MPTITIYETNGRNHRGRRLTGRKMLRKVVYDQHINTELATATGLYQVLFNPRAYGEVAGNLVLPLEIGMQLLEEYVVAGKPAAYMAYKADMLRICYNLLGICRQYPDGYIKSEGVAMRNWI